MYTAIIGISCKFPGANNYEEFWENLAHGKVGITEIPKKRWDWRAYWGDPQKEKNKSQSKWGGFIRQVDAFDMNFFGLTPKVVQTMDPQQRIMLELAWACFEDAGIPPSAVKGSKTGVFLGVFNHDYKELQESGDLDIEAHHSTGTATTVIPNRVSHYFSLMGPSVPIDTACSSSLNAIHNAIQAMEYGDCEMALAGGINLLLTPTRHISFSKMGMLSPTGSCKTFDNSADGYVRGEGAAVLLLKPLEQALADGNSIHAVIKGSAVNHCGKTYTLTFPNPEAQADVMVSAHRRADVPVHSVSYIEAHGTGTPKGDPLEFKGLLSAFEQLAGGAGVPPATQTGWCGLGSVKTNIGHLEAAAGVAGVIKVVMSLQHRQLPPLPNYSKLNARITLEDTPFYIVDKLQEWKPSLEKAPLRAGISSFGFGGTNSHVVLEEAPSIKRVKGKHPVSYLICLSAKTEAALDKKRQDLLAWLEKDNGETDLLSISATLLMGRDHFDFREAYVVKSLAELQFNLKLVIRGSASAPPVKEAASMTGLPETALETEMPENYFESSFLKTQPEAENEGNEERREVAEKALESFASGKFLSPSTYKKKICVLAKLYALGEDLDWKPLFSGFKKGQVRRVHLPTYPFARDCCWIESGGVNGKGNGGWRMENGELSSKLHPLVHHNVSTLEEQCFSSTFSGDEFFFTDHKVRGQMVLPEVALLEMAREAVARAAATLEGRQNSVCLRDVVWGKPVCAPTVADSKLPKTFYIGVYPENSSHNGSVAPSRNDVGFEVFGKSRADDITVYCQGGALVSDDVEVISTRELSVLKAAFQQDTDLARCCSAEQCYRAFANMGLEYGPAFRSIETLCFNAEGDQCLAKLSLPAGVSDSQGHFLLHPVIADAAVQAAIALASGIDQIATGNPAEKKAAVKPFIPLMLQELTVMGGNDKEKLSSRNVWAWVRTSDNSERKDCGTFDIDLHDAQGEMYAQMKGLILQRNKEQALERNHGTVFLHPAWEERDIDSNAASVQYGEHVIVLCEPDTSEEINIPGAVYLVLDGRISEGKANDIGQRFQLYTNIVFEKVQKLLKRHPKDKILFQIVVPLREEQQVLAGMAGLLGAARKENSKFVGQLIGIDEIKNTTDLIEKLQRNSVSPVDQVIRYAGGKRSVSVWYEVDSSTLNNPCIPWRGKGVYLITGGTGGLGLIFAREIAQRTKGAIVILTGRSAVSKEKETQIEALHKLGVHAEYRQVDVSRLSELRALLESIQKEFGGLQGIIHCAGLFQTNMMIMKQLEELNSTLAPKVSGVVNLDRASKDMPLDFVIYCSSIASYLGNSGLADYAAANAFMDAFARYRNELVSRTERSGQTLSINWPVWKEGGIQVGDAAEEMLHRQLGSVPMATATGIQALYKALASGCDQVLVMDGEVDRIKGNLLSHGRATISDAVVAPSSYENLSSSNVSSMVSTLRSGNTGEVESGTSDNSELERKSLKSRLLTVLAQKASEVLGVGIDNIKVEAELNSYGFDSVLLVNFANQLNDEYNTALNAPVFFEHRTLVALTHYMLEEYSREIAAYFGIRTGAEEPVSGLVEAESVGISDTVSGIESKRQRFRTLSVAASQGERFYSSTANGFALREEISFSPTEYSPQADPPSPPAKRRVGDAFPLGNPLSTQRQVSQSLEPIAIIGMSGRFPMAEDINEYWKNLLEGKDCISEVPKSRWDWEAIYGDPTREGNKTDVKWGGFIEGVDEFDPLFFNISPHEAELMDPQHRLLMTYVWKVIEDAGYSAKNLAGSNTAIYVGTENSNYASLVLPGDIEGYSLTSQACAVGPNRMSFFLDFHGPSEPVDTACSSSLVAVHKAVIAIRGGHCEAAVVGGINTMLTREGYIARSKAGMLSADGRCKTFSDQANGYVPGEGVGMLFLKGLSRAERDGDHIYGLIRGTAENHGGRSNSLTAPNPVAQAELLKTAYTQAGIDPRTISYIEAHGTGTPLGDPIEINGLKTAFKDLYQATADSELSSANPVFHCGIGAVKSNIGHLELASGVAGIIKVLLQLKYKTLVKSLHSETINPYIQLEGSPFYVVQAAKPWDPIKDRQGKELPRRAGVSSFGFGGVNAHVIIEEYVTEPNKSKVEDKGSKLIILSAKNGARLLEQAKGLLKIIDTENLTDSDLVNMAYTLQVGRDAMDERLGVLATSIESLKEKLQAFVDGKESIEGLYRGKVATNKDSLAILADDADMAKTVEAWIQKGKYEKVLSLWVRGLEFDWKQLYEKHDDTKKPRRISLPSYPFGRDRYWLVRKVEERNKQESSESIDKIHPLLHRNTSTLSEQRFSSVFNGDEFFLEGYRVKGQRVAPKAIFLELARMAVAQAAETSLEGIRIQLRQVEWGQPLEIGEEPAQVHISLFPASENSDEITFEVYGEPVEKGGGSILYALGGAVIGKEEAAEPLDLPSLQSLSRKSNLSKEQSYEAFKTMGLEVGTGFQNIDSVFVGENQVLVKLSLSDPSVVKTGKLELDPRLLDSAFQAVLVISTRLDSSRNLESERLTQISSLNTFDVMAPCASSMWVYIRYSDSSLDKDGPTLDIDMCDEQGNICVRMKGCSLSDIDIQEKQENQGALILKPEWVEREINSDLKPVQYSEHFVVLCELGKLSESVKQYIKTLLPNVDCIILDANSEEVDSLYQYHASRIFEKIQEIIKAKPKSRILFQVLIPHQGKHQVLLGITGLIGAARKENSKFVGQILCVNTKDSPANLMDKLKENSGSSNDYRIQYVDGKRLVATWREIEAHTHSEFSVPWKDKGVYLITGGAGALGLHCSRAIAKNVKEATVILIGRSALSLSKLAELDTLRNLGVRVKYKQVDICRKAATLSLVEGIKEEFGGLHGIIHCAGVVQVNLIVNKAKEELSRVMEPKVLGTVNLDQASKNIPLDFVVYFSSISGYLGNDGLSDYALANAFMDAYAKYRNELVVTKQRSGHTLSINWPVWKETGMETDSSTVELLRHTLGIEPIETDAAMNALYISMVSDEGQTLVLPGDHKKIRNKVIGETGASIMAVEATVNNIIGDDFQIENELSELNQKVKLALIDLSARLLKIQTEDIDIDGQLSGYGFDSISLTKFANEINREYDLELTPTVFFEHSSIANLAKYLVEEYQASMASRFPVKAEISAPSVKKAVAESKTTIRRPSVRFFTQKKTSPPGRNISKSIAQEPVAIIGMSGCFPQAKDIDEFWNNLTEGKDCITEVPKNRWDWQNINGNSSSDEDVCNVKWGGFIEGLDEFDPLFFNISPAEAKVMDPQHRLLMMYAWKVIEDAGYSAQSLSGRNIAIYVGLAHSGYETVALSRSIESFSIASQLSAVGPNRISYFMNFHGPSEPIDTACSSSLVAIHRAVMVINKEGCEAAIVGGVNTLLNHGLYIARDKAGMLSIDGHCKTFSEHANGYIPGEGVGMLFLKKLSMAEKDGDHIYGLIRGSAENHGGRSNSLTAPNPKAQAELLKTAYTQARVDPRTVSYIEAHGTGTRLGDPIEIEGLKTAFQDLNKNTVGLELTELVTEPFCGLGAVKSNIGHLELAAGVAGVIKVLLQLKHRTLVKTLHNKPLNPYIKLEGSPFYIVEKTKDWVPIKDSKGNELPRRAGVSSFGVGGVNAHVIIEEYMPEEQLQSSVTHQLNKVIIPLSAKNSERLLNQVQNLLEAIETQSLTDRDLEDIAYTLQVGRAMMEERLAILVESIEALKEKLKDFLNGNSDVTDLYRGRVGKSEDSLIAFADDVDLANTISRWVIKGRYSKLLDLWVKGLEFNWGQLYLIEKSNDRPKPRRISLPSYPFTKERYWIDDRVEEKTDKRGIVTTELHPLLHKNTSTLSEQRFSSLFRGDEFFFTDHVINGKRILPGVAYLEMVRSAIVQATEVMDRNASSSFRFNNVVWTKPIIIENKILTIHVGLSPNDENHISYEIYCEQGPEEAEPVIHGQGQVQINSVMVSPVIDLRVLKSQCNERKLSAEYCYSVYGSLGMVYGPAFRGIKEVFVGKRQALARIKIPESVTSTAPDYLLHPSLLDAALQASIGLLMGDKGMDEFRIKPIVPFALDELHIFSPCNLMMWALVRFSQENFSNAKLQKLDVDLCDDNGQVCVRMKGFTTRILEENMNQQSNRAIQGSLMLQPYWREQSIDSVLSVSHNREYWGEYWVILCEPSEGLHRIIETQLDRVRYLSLQSDAIGIEERYSIYAEQVFEQLQIILRSRPKTPVLVQIVISCDIASDGYEKQLYAGLFGMLKTAHQENPKLTGQLIEIEAKSVPDSIVDRLVDNSRILMEKHIRYQNGKRWVAGWRTVDGVSPQKENEVSSPWKEGGIYLVTGGAGGLGLLFAEDIAKKAKGARIVLTGRSPLSAGKTERLQSLRSMGAVIDYRQVDIGDSQSTENLIQSIQAEFGGLNGIVHSAGVIRDNFILNKTQDELREVLIPKVSGLVNLDQASRDVNLDFLAVFSSMTGVLGNVGQADYAAGNAFMDAYAHYRNRLVAAGQRKGKTVSINWPLWKEGGMLMDAESERAMEQNTGLVAMTSEVGLRAFYQAIAQGGSQWMVMEGDLDRIRLAVLEPLNRQSVAVQSPPAPVEKAKESGTVPAIAEDILKEKAVDYFKKLLSSVIKLPSHRIEADAPLEQYGIDSIMVVQLTNQLEKAFGSLPKTLFFEYRNIEELSGYFLESYAEQLNALLGIDKHKGMNGRDEESDQRETSLPDNQAIVPSQPVISTNTRRQRQRFSRSGDELEAQQSRVNGRVDIAIIGMSGRYPQANTLEEFWINLRNGKDCITEIPEDRWDHTQYFDEDKNKPGKTYSKWGGFIADVDKFDPLYFNISPREAEIIDPQERLFLQCSIETIQDAGYTRDTLGKANGVAGNVGVYVGVMYEEYQLYGAQETLQGHPIALSGSAASIANRVSYFCNFQGPSMAVDTMCSSSLTAIHLGCQSLYREECKLVIAGGVNVSIHPNKYLMLGQGKFVSSKGRCESFGVGGDGYVPGEGVGAVLLKPLSHAEADRDHIYGVIKGTAVNHGGKTNGYSVPNPNAQSGVIERALRESGTDPRTISYIEAHGTGTSLGDPIEIAGLAKAFKAFTSDKQFCAIGSAKSNIGHCESAAGIAGVTKVLLQLRHKQLVPSLHSEVLNPNIDFEVTPFVVQQTLVDWKRPVVKVNGEEKEYPCLAGISSFGAGGSNAHIIIQEYMEKEREQHLSSDQPLLIVLSAKNPAQLMESVWSLYSYLEKNPGVNLLDLAYTLQVGREAMEERLAILVNSLEQLTEKLKAYQESQGRSDNIEELYQGKAKQNKKTLSVFSADKELQEAVDKWIQRGKYAKLLDLWAKGLDIDWVKLYSNSQPKRISLPTYPFERTRYWVPDSHVQNPTNTGNIDTTRTNIIHPLIHQNSSTLFEQRFSTTFNGREPLLAGRLVNGRCLLPCIAYLEMASVAVAQAVGMSSIKPSGMLIKNIAWMTPIIIGEQEITVSTGLYLADSTVDDSARHIDFEIFSEPDNPESERVLHGQGQVIISEIPMAPVLNLEQLREQCGSLYSKEDCYNVLKKIGFAYGEAYRTLQSVEVGRGQAIAKLSLVENVDIDEYVLHPSLLDSSIQAAVILFLKNNGAIEGEFDSLQAILPSALDELQVLNSCLNDMWAWIRYADNDGGTDNKIDIDLCDNAGQIHIRLKGMVLKNQEAELASSRHSTLMLRPEWLEQPVNVQMHLPEYAQHLVILCEAEEELREQIEGTIKGVSCLNLICDESSINGRFETYSEKIFEQVKTLLNTKPKNPILIQVVIRCDANSADERQLFAGLCGLLTTAYRENPKLIGQVIDIDSAAGNALLVDVLMENRYELAQRYIRYHEGRRWVRDWHEIQASKSDQVECLPWRDKGVYLITGGAGGLGFLFASDIAQKVKGATLILTGRSSLNDEKIAQLKILEKLVGDSTGGTVDYCQVDVTDSAVVDELIKNILNKYGSLNGIIHSAGVTRDSFIINKTQQELHDVLAPKVSGLVNLDQASRDINLNFLAVFSSISGVLGNAGQADYATANAFMDSYVHYRNQLVSLGERSGHTLSINWPLWKEGGMHVDAQAERLMEQNTGMVALSTEKGLLAFYKAMEQHGDQCMVIEGNAAKVREKVLGILPVETAKVVGNQESIAKTGNPGMEQIDLDRLREKTLLNLGRLFGTVVKLDVGQIERDERWESYGVESVMIMQLNNQLAEIFGDLSKTLFFEYQTLSELAEYFLSEHQTTCLKWAGLDTEPQRHQSKERVYAGTDTVSSRLSEAKQLPRINRQARRTMGRQWGPAETGLYRKVNGLAVNREPIAIIGLSGRYPQAGNLDEYWENLAAGKDCIGEIPEERWSLEGFFADDMQTAMEQGKSYSKWGGFVDGFAEFDSLFFGISPKEAMSMDPQERLFMQCCWHTFEDAGYTRERIARQHQGRVGVFAGITKTGYDLYGPDLWRQGEQVFPHTSFSSVANRLSYLMDLHGPSMPIDTMCSSSLTAIHEACRYLREGDCEMALAGGVNLYVHPSTYVGLCAMQMLSVDGQCKSFGAGGNGFVPGEGVGTALLKPLSRAESDGDHIYAVVRATNINHGGKTNGYTVPSPTAQGELIWEAIEKAGVSARAISYIEAHGTGTELGDPIEVTGLTQAFRKDTQDTQFCALGSAKSNIGHLEAAAGIAGLTKIILQMQHQQLVPSLHAKTLNPNINFAKTPFVVQQELGEWSRPKIDQEAGRKEYPRIAGISSFGAGGANAHVIIEEYRSSLPEKAAVRVDSQHPALVVLSAKTDQQLRIYVHDLLNYIKKHPEVNVTDIAYTLQIGREAMDERLGLLVNSMEMLTESLLQYVKGKKNIEGLYRGRVKQNKATLGVFASDEEFQETINRWIQREKYSKLIELWVRGLEVDWMKLHDNELPHCVSLPTYPFAKDNCWIPIVKSSHPDSNGSQKINGNGRFDGNHYKQLLKKVVSEELSVEAAVLKIKSSMHKNARIGD